MQNKFLNIPRRTLLTKVSAILLCLFLLFSSLTFLETPYLKIQYASADSWSFITRSGSTLQNNGNTFKFGGSNMHWLGSYDSGTAPTQFQIDDAMTTAQEMGETVVRSFLAASAGYASSIEPSLGQFNDSAFSIRDYAIYSAHNHGIRLILPLVLTGSTSPFGGTSIFTNWEGDSNQDNFFTNSSVIADYKAYISHVLNHVNPYTGLAYKDDPTIMAWETGNEMHDSNGGTWTDTWTETIASYIKSIAPNQLVADGHAAQYNQNTTLTTSQLQLADVDLYTDHFYPPNDSLMQTNANLAVQNNKVYYVGEYDWTDQATIPANGTVSQDSTTSTDGTYSALVDVTKSNPNWWYVQLYQPGFSLQSGQTYTVGFDVKTDNSNELVVGLQQSVNPYTTYKSQFFFNLGSSWGHHSFTYTPAANLPLVMINFNYAVKTGNVWIDNVSVSSGSGNLISNPSFEDTGSSWLSPWAFQVKPGSGDTLATFLPAVQSTSGVSGFIYWELFGHMSTHGFYTGGDQYKLLYPGNTTDVKNREQLLRTNAYKISGTTVPPHIIPIAPSLTSVTATSGGTLVDWRGSAGAASYNLEKTTDGINWSTSKTGLIDYSVPADPTDSGNPSYRLVPISLDGLRGTASNIVPPLATPSAAITPAPTTIAIPTPISISLPAFSSYVPPKLPITPNPNSLNTMEQTGNTVNTSSLQPLPLEVNQHIYPKKTLSVKLVNPNGTALTNIPLTLPTNKKQKTDQNGSVVFTDVTPGNHTITFTYNNLPGNITISIPDNKYLKQWEVTAVVSIGNKLSGKKISSLFHNLLSLIMAHKPNTNV